MIKCNSCRGVGEEKKITNNEYVAVLPHKRSIRKCPYCNSINVRPTNEALSPPSWYRETITIDGEQVANVIGLSLFALK